ncbi:hypothetical protein [Lederbergia citri]|uniref:Uncharacterized protein n=1 Tax=Lederbergia citri TaxID=2833580 RepID=A0A942THD4_9BACI|nr:hypothetical protein [Lederbergia citri]MBS4196389.1 hypothetical protein [Lederbergia citri]
MYEYEFMAEMRKKEIEKWAREAWKYQDIHKRSYLKSLFTRFSKEKAIPTKECNCACVC